MKTDKNKKSPGDDFNTSEESDVQKLEDADNPILAAEDRDDWPKLEPNMLTEMEPEAGEVRLFKEDNAMNGKIENWTELRDACKPDENTRETLENPACAILHLIDESEIHTEERQEVPPTKHLGDGFCEEKPAPPDSVMEDAPELDRPNEMLTTEIEVASGRSNEIREEQEFHREFAETMIPSDEVDVTEKTVFPTIHESAIQIIALDAEAPILILDTDKV